MSNIPVNNLDFFAAKEDLKAFLKGQESLKDYDFEGSNMNVLIDVLANNTFKKAIYDNMLFSERYLDSAQTRGSVMSNAKELNYLPASKRSAYSYVTLSFNAQNNPATIEIPALSKFRASCGNKSFNFITDKSYIVKPSNGTYTIEDVKIYEGKIITEMHRVVDENEFTIGNDSVDITSIRVFVRGTDNVNAERSEYVLRNDIFGVKKTDKVFYIEPHFDGLYQVAFGRDLFGRNPKVNEIVEIEYRTTLGRDANGAKNFTAVEQISGYSVSVTQSTVADYGADEESISDIKFFAPKSLQVQERAVSDEDYSILLKRRFPNIQSISVFSGSEADPPRHGKVIIAVDHVDSDGAGASEIAEYSQYISPKSVGPIKPIFQSAKFMYVSMDINVRYNPSIYTGGSGSIESMVRQKIVEFNDENLNKFNGKLYQSKLTNTIDNINESILSTDIKSYPIIEYKPEIKRPLNPSFSFYETLNKPYPFSEDRGFVSYVPAVSSSKFVVFGTQVSIQDDGLGKLFLVTEENSKKRLFKRNVGNIDYNKGTIKLSNLSVDDFDGNGIKLIANTVNKDIISPKDRILKIRLEDVKINISTVN